MTTNEPTMSWSTATGHDERITGERERASLPAPQAHVPVTRPAWAASPAAFRERLRGACELSLAPGEGTQVGGLGRWGGEKGWRERDTKPLKLLHGLTENKSSICGEEREGGGGRTGSSTGETGVINWEPRGCRGHPVTAFAS